jgi:hypothetical protein
MVAIFYSPAGVGVDYFLTKYRHCFKPSIEKYSIETESLPKACKDVGFGWVKCGFSWMVGLLGKNIVVGSGGRYNGGMK